MNTVLAVIRARKDQGTTLSEAWKEEVTKAFGEDDIKEARSVLKETLKIQEGGRRIADKALDDIARWLRESEHEEPQLEVLCSSSHLPQVAAFMVRSKDLGPEAVVSLSTRIEIMEEQMKALTVGISSFKKEVQREQRGAGTTSLNGLQQEQEHGRRSRAGKGGPPVSGIQQ